MSTSPYSGKTYGTATTNKSSSAPTVQYDTKTGAKLASGQSTMVNGVSQVAGSAYTGANAYGSGSTKVAYDSKTGSMRPEGGSNYVDPTASTDIQTPVGTLQPDPGNTKVNSIDPTSNIQNFDPNTGKPLAPGQVVQNKMTGQNVTQGTPFQQAFQKTKASGISAPTTMGQANPTINSTLPSPTQNPPSPLTPIVDTDKNFDNIFSQFDDFFSPPKQKQSLLQEYQSMEKSLGINSMNAELLNSKRIIDGTEDDIRSEVQAVSGFATDSQVMALANARNKSLVKNYNYLLESRDSAMTQLNTMMNLSIADRKSAQDEFDTKMNFAFKVKEFQMKAVDNAREGYNNVIKNAGYAGLYQSLQKDPSSIPLVEKTLGLTSGGLQRLSTYVKPLSEEDKLDLQLKRSQLATDSMQRKNIQSQINERGTTIGDVPEKVMTKIQSSPEYKTINGVLPALQSLRSYKDAVDKYGTSEILNGSGKGELAGTYGNAIAAWKTLAGLGALSGADFALAENAVPSTGFFQRASTMKGKLDASITNAITQAETLTKRLQQNYPQAKDNLQRQLDEAKTMAYPDKFKMGGDGNVYELTN